MDTHKGNALALGAWSGLFAGIIFGAMLGMMGMLPVIAKLVGSDNAFIGFLAHIVISIIIGIIFAVLFDKHIKNTQSGILAGILYGLVWWILGPLVLMPLFLGAGVMFSAGGIVNALPSLWGHLVYGAFFGFVYNFIVVERKISGAKSQTE